MTSGRSDLVLLLFSIFALLAWSASHRSFTHNGTGKNIIKKLDSQESVEAYLKDMIRKDITIQTKKPSEMSIEELRQVEEEYNVILKMFKDAAHN